jgi:hypothetical protein
VDTQEPGRHDDADGDGVADFAENSPYRAATDASAISRDLTAHAVTVTSVLARNGLVLVDELVEAAHLEGAEIAVAATLMAAESNARNVWGHDGVSTGGHYTKGGPVTQANYLAYRAAMRAGQIGRQGCGPAQATSAYYQDLADSLGGCWLPVPNMRAGLRGLQHLIGQYGVAGGAQRYNGSGPAAIAYGKNFLARYQTWQTWLFGTVVDPAPSTPSTPIAPAAYGDLMQDKYPLVGTDVDIWDVACGSAAIDGRWVVLTFTLFAGALSTWVDFQSDAGGVGQRINFTLSVGPDNLSPRQIIPVPGGATKARIGWDSSHAQKASLTVTGGK